MTTGWRVRVARALLHRDTFELFVAPAIADYQHAPSAAAVGAVATSVTGALVHDLAGDVSTLMQDIALLLGLVTIQACYYGAMLLILAAHVRADEALAHLTSGAGARFTATVIGLVIASTLPMLLCFWPPRRTMDV
jgi:hypothetical protein